MPAKKKYKLLSQSSISGGGPAPCAFFATEAGCKSGATCKFSHGIVEAPSPQRQQVHVDIEDDASSSAVSSESEGGYADGAGSGAGDVFVPPGQVEPEHQSKKKRKKSAEQMDMFAKPKGQKTPSASSSPWLKKGASPSNPPAKAGSYAAMADHVPVQPVQQAQTPPPFKKQKKSKQKQQHQQEQQQPIASFRNLDLPIASFTVPDHVDSSDTPETPGGGCEHGPGDSPQHESAPSDMDEPATCRPLPLPRSTPEGRRWQKAVLTTRRNSKYESSFDFHKYQNLDEEAGRSKGADEWIAAKPYGPWCKGNPHAIAIDCEMCETKDPVSGVTDPKALCRVSIVNAVNPEEVLLDTLVKPTWPVSHHRTNINGIKKEDLANVQFTLRHCQAFLMALCSEETVIIGHAVHNDLVAMKMVHHCVADSAFLFEVKDEPRATCSLKDLAMAVLKKEMPDTHDSVNDARTALQCLEKGWVEKDGENVEPVVRTFPPKNRCRSGNGGGGSNELFVHRIPRMCQPTHISSMFLAHTHIQPKEVPDIEFSGKQGKTTIMFLSASHARLAFETLGGEIKEDKTGREQKRVYLRNGDYVYVRKMVKVLRSPTKEAKRVGISN